MKVLARKLLLVVRLARRELRGGVRGYRVFLACLALGVAAITAVGVVASSMDHAVSRDARTLLGGDFQISQVHVPIAENVRQQIETYGDTASYVRMRAMARAAKDNHSAETPQRPTLVELKAVGPAYPLLGDVEFTPAMPLESALASRDGTYGCIVAPELLERLGVAVGDALQLGRAILTIRGELVREPDQPSSFFGLGPRILLSRAGLETTGLLQPGSVTTYYMIVRLDDPTQLETVKTELEAMAEPGWRLNDYRTASPRLARFFDNLSVYLTLVGLAALLVGGIGVANGVRASLETKMEAIAVMKCLGAERREVIAIYLTQTMVMALAGSVLGVTGGYAAAFLATPLLQQLLTVPVAIVVDAGTIALALTYGLLTALAFACWPLSAAGGVSPARLFRGYGEPTQAIPTRKTAVVVTLTGLALLGVTMLFAGKPGLTLGFAGGILLAMIIFRLLAKVVMRTAKAAPRSRNPRLRHAVANLHRPGAPTPAVLFSLGLGLTVLVTVSQVDGSLQRAIAEQLPEGAPSFFFLDIPGGSIDEFRATVASVAGVSELNDEPSVRGRITHINGVPAAEAAVSEDVAWALRGDRGVTFATAPPEGSTIVRGEWWPPDYDGPPAICFGEDLAQGFGVGPGDTLTISVLGRPITATIACTRTIEWSSLALNHAIIFAPGVLENAPHAYIATAYTESQTAEDALFAAITRKFPNVVAVYVREALEDAEAIIRGIGMAIRVTASVTLAAGLLVLTQTLAATIRRRQYDAVVFKALGATRWDIMQMMILEFILLGAATALTAAVIGAVLAWGFVHYIAKLEYGVLWGPLLWVTLGGVAATLTLGLASMRQVLSRSAWEELRNE